MIASKKPTIRRLNGKQNESAPVVVRLFWLALLLLHFPAIVSLTLSQFDAWGPLQTSEIVRLAGMSLSAAFFSLKVADVRCLRLRPGWRSFVTAAIVVALIHVGVVERAASGDLEVDPAQFGLVCVLGTLSGADQTRQRLRLRLAAALRVLAACGNESAKRVVVRFDRLREISFNPHELFLVHAYAGPRAPPTC